MPVTQANTSMLEEQLLVPSESEVNAENFLLLADCLYDLTSFH